MKAILWLLILKLILQHSESSSICNAINEEINREKLATKTGYIYSLKDESYWGSFKHASMGCTPIKVWFISRHGTRYPVKNDIAHFDNLPKISDAILYNHLHGRGCLSEEDVFEFKRWLPPYEPRDKGQLHATGAEELYSLGEYWRDLYPNIFAEPYNQSIIKVDFTIRNRTGQSAYQFLRGMYGDDAVGKIKLPKPSDPNFVLRFYKSCPLWLRDVYRNNKTTYKERNLFQLTNEFQDVVKTVSYRLGYLEPLSEDDIAVIYDECRYESAWYLNKESIWCKPFSDRDIEILEYHQDLKYYYEDSYGIKLNKEIACKAVSDLYIHLKKKIDSKFSLPNGVLYFTHDKALMKILALLGLFEPKEALRHNNFNLTRKFKTSVVASFASNLGFVLYRCEETNSYKVGMFFNGNPMPLTSVCSTILCDWKTYQKFLEPIFLNCDLNKLCKLHDEL